MGAARQANNGTGRENGGRGKGREKRSSEKKGREEERIKGRMRRKLELVYFNGRRRIMS